LLTGFYVFAYRFVRIVNFELCRYFRKVRKVSRRREWVTPALASPRFPVESSLIDEITPGCVSSPRTLVWIDDYKPGLALYKMMFEMVGYRVLTASSGKLGLELVASHSVDAVVVDYEMPEMNGYEVAAALKRKWPNLPIVMFSGLTSVPSKVFHVVNAFCDKASSREELLATVQAVLTNNPSSHLQPTSLPLASQQAQRTVA